MYMDNEGVSAEMKIGVTPEMVAAGVERYIDLLFNECDHEWIVREVFCAMMQVRAKSTSQTLEPAR